MNITLHARRTRLAVALGAALLATACAAPPTTPEAADSARTRLARLQSDPELASRAAVEIRDAESAVRAAEAPQRDKDVTTHLVLMADRRIDIATARARARLYEDQRAELTAERATARLDARTREADQAHHDATLARSDAVMARMDTESAREDAADLRREIADLNARETERGLIVTLGDLQFATGGAGLRDGATAHLAKLAAFLNRYEDRLVRIEGHTDSVGSERSNLGLSRRRADAVKTYLVDQGVSGNRLDTSGRGEDDPVADNATADGRQQNRRVEVVISTQLATVR